MSRRHKSRLEEIETGVVGIAIAGASIAVVSFGFAWAGVAVVVWWLR